MTDLATAPAAPEATEYISPTDELTRITLRKRGLEEEIRRINRRIAEVEQTVVDELIARGESGAKHAATGASLRLKRQVWAKLDVDTEGLSSDEETLVKAELKGRAGGALMEAGLGDYVRPDFNLNSISAYFREQVKAYDAEQAELPEDQRVPRDVESFLPEPLRGLLRLDATPKIEVRA